MKLLFVIIIITQVYSQLDVTGRVTLSNSDVDYDETALLKPADDATYSITDLIPGNNQILNLSLFARSQSLEYQLISDIRNSSDWKKLSFNDISRLSLGVSSQSFNLSLGDFFEYHSEQFLANRDFRGARIDINFQQLFSDQTSRIKVMYGIVERERAINEQIFSSYQTYESIGVYQRNMLAAIADLNLSSNLSAQLNFINAADREDFALGVDDEPLKNNVMGASLNYFLMDRRLFMKAIFHRSSTDTVYENASNSLSNTGSSYKVSTGFVASSFNIEAYKFRLDADYFTMGNPYLEVDKDGLGAKSNFRFGLDYYARADFETYEDNLDNDSLYTTKSNIFYTEFGSNYSGGLNAAVSFSLLSDLSDEVNGESVDKVSKTYEGRLSYDFNELRLSGSYTHIDFDDQSVFSSGSSISSTQNVMSFNYYYSNQQSFESSGGLVYSAFSGDDQSEIKSTFIYLSAKQSIIPQTLRLELNANFTLGDGSAAVSEDDTDQVSNNLSNYLNQFNSHDYTGSLEYFFSYSMSAKLSYGSNKRSFDYLKNFTISELVTQLNTVEDLSFFDKNEDYSAQILTLELNILF